jgi:hypothetical protein
MYGVKCELFEYGMEGQMPNGFAAPDADMEFMVAFDTICAGCDSWACTPGVDIVWSATGYNDVQHVGMQDSQRCGYCDTYRVVAPKSGTMIVTAKSANTVTWVVHVMPVTPPVVTPPVVTPPVVTPPVITPPYANGIVCDDSQTLCVENRYLSFCTDRATGLSKYTDNGVGSCGSVVPPYVPPVITPPGTTCQHLCSEDYCDDALVHWKCTGGCAVQDGGSCTTVTPPSTTATDPIKVLTDFYNANKTLSIVGIALLGGIIVFGE